jgi:hypothetical protein
MVYRSLGVLFSSAGITIALVEFHENAGKWTFELKADYNSSEHNVKQAIQDFIEKNELQYKIALITTHAEEKEVDISGASIAVITSLPVITDLAALDLELGGNGEFYKTTSEKLRMTDKEMTDLHKTICVAFMGILRWREEYNFLSSVTGASRSSIGGAIWLGQEA